MVTLDIFSDPICPWCYIGWKQLTVALERAETQPFDIRWRPFMLNPEMPAGGMDRTEYLELKFGGRDGVLKSYGPVVEAAEAAGVVLNLDKIARTPRTLDAHRLLHWAGIEGDQIAVANGLFAAYFVDGRDIEDAEVLCDIADSSGMDAALVARLLANDADVDELRGLDQGAREMGVSSVPTFVVAGRHAVPGAQPPDLWAKVIEELAE